MSFPFGGPPPFNPYSSTLLPAFTPTFPSQPPISYVNFEEIRTIFITGFPKDVKDRELNNLLRFLPGYSASQLTWKNDQAQGFALFETGQNAQTACTIITGTEFDESCFLRCEMARKNMFTRDENQGQKRQRTTVTLPDNIKKGFSNNISFNFNNNNNVSNQSCNNNGSSTSDNPPCSTIFIGNLSDTVNEDELVGLFRSRKGFLNYKIVRGRSVNAFIEFDDISAAIAAHDSLQGTILRSSDRGGIRIQYSKNPFGKRKDRT
mmetsp:Transcript_18014/g.32892  ORF Transcript_18014/g.32892 Transcript_18014/m.32892 type:complete len:263 (-) Transcript_18014:1965-2753(-)|eukprot:CAMPEP_0175054086 /NCGR_PEP_ID=MMETSP0052_2-20121109/9302_1 /TAXON_ID=51329 ORGANISM="Polytomella parva, Strain SAG 63-3" /NCGR_SAMPLE_ID=MMETSP0052_2 /ASSEMBLY_ACC=CAM_ASM_000194 /LENGTH=262 /DNA_ID=CAMNT_0016318727 /DNA_START=46 /DNA_END=834 /DNA_ORIENTATION=-